MVSVEEQEDDDDYMSMNFADPEPAAPITSLHRQQAKRKQAEAAARPKSKKELEADAAAARNAALATALDPANKGARLMAKLGYKGGALGKTQDGRTQPVELLMKGDRGGIGMDNEKKRKIREAMEAVQGKEKRQKAGESEFLERNRREREEKRFEAQTWAAMKVVEKFDTDADGGGGSQEPHQSSPSATNVSGTARDLKKVNILWRGLARRRVERERERRLRHDVGQGLSLHKRDDPEEDTDDKIALGSEIEEIEDEDPELDEFNALEPAERLMRLVQYLRDTYHYCFWCKYQYSDDTMDGCPGLTEEDHD